MSSRNTRPATFYNDQVEPYPRSRAPENLLDHFQNASALITSALIVLAVLATLLSPDGSLEGGFLAVGSFAWDAILYIVPAPLLFAADAWLSPPASPQPMRNSQQSSHAAKSEVLRRIMGLDRPDGMMSSIFRARTHAISVTSSVLGLKADPDRPPGLGNRDNSCYQNSILQGLASLPPMSDYLATCIQGLDINSEENRKSKNVAQTLRTLIADLNDASNNGTTLWTPSLLKSMSTWTQQDAQEYYSVILDDIDKGAALAVKAMSSGRMPGLEGSIPTKDKDENSDGEHSDDSGYQSSASSPKSFEMKKMVRNPLEGLLAQRVSCVQCGQSDGLSMVPFNCLTLSLGLDKHQHDLYDRLDSYSKLETIEGVDCPKCTLLKAQRLLVKFVDRLRGEATPEEQLQEPLRRLQAVNAALEEDDFDEDTLKNKCKIPTRVSTTKTKQMVIARPPQSLVIHINRSVFDPSTFDMIKNSAPVHFPMMLDLGPWCLGSAPPDIKNEGNATGEHEFFEELWEVDPMVSMIAGDLQQSRLVGPLYKLRAAVTHYGRHENGHYICYRNYPSSKPPHPGSQEDKEGAEVSNQVTDGGIDYHNFVAGAPEAEPPKIEFRTSPDSAMDWWRLSDHNVSRVDEELVSSLAPGVFMLFYDCVDPTMILLPTEDEISEEDAIATGEVESDSTSTLVGADQVFRIQDNTTASQVETSGVPGPSTSAVSAQSQYVPHLMTQEEDRLPTYEEVMRGDP